MPKNNNRAPYISVLCVTAAAAVLALAACGHGGTTSTSPPPSPSSPPRPNPVNSHTSPTLWGQLTGLRDGSKVPYQQQVSGVVTGLPSGNELWIVVTPVAAPTYWPQQGPLQLDSKGGFRTSVYFGGSGTQNTGENFIVRLVAAPPAASARFQAFLAQSSPSQGLLTLPPGIETLTQVTVTRR